MSNDPAITTAVVAGSYITAMLIGCSPQSYVSVSPQNFAVALGIISMQTFAGAIGSDSTNWTWIYLVFPWVGSLAAVFTYECIFKRAQAAVEAVDGDHDAPFIDGGNDRAED